MIEHVRGQLVRKAPTFAVVDVQGTGYGLSTSLATYEQLPAPGDEAQLVAHLYVREDRMELFGFAGEPERAMFRLLISVSGIGPHLALVVLSGLELGELRDSIYHGRTAELTAIKGIGRKTAERMILDLRDKVSPSAADGAVEAPDGGARAGQSGEAEMALVALGIASTTARQAIDKVQKKAGGVLSVQDLIKQALRQR
jgi:holliday junction DNA helicase RuvA